MRLSQGRVGSPHVSAVPYSIDRAFRVPGIWRDDTTSLPAHDTSLSLLAFHSPAASYSPSHRGPVSLPIDGPTHSDVARCRGEVPLKPAKLSNFKVLHHRRGEPGYPRGNWTRGGPTGPPLFGAPRNMDLVQTTFHFHVTNRNHRTSKFLAPSKPTKLHDNYDDISERREYYPAG
jgi:hypothetical protein